MHGGDIYRNIDRSRISLDFSVNVNPLGLPEKVRRALHDAVEDSQRYPDLRVEELRRALGRMAGIDDEDILCGNGASELFMAVIHGLRPEKVLIPTPSFYGYERAAMAGMGEVRYYTMEREQNFCLTESFLQELSADTGLLFLANPNNPVGNLIHAKLLEEILKICMERGIVVVLDECFMDFYDPHDSRSFLRRIYEFTNLIVVRAFTKIYAMPGVRLGYLACADRRLRDRILAQLPEWNVSAFAQRAGIAAAEETGYKEKTVRLIVEERAYLMEELQNIGMSVYPSDVNFLLFHSPKDLWEGMLKRGILIRDCSDFRGLSKGFYRICVRQREDNKRLLAGIREIMDGTN